jgi:hypothetical protein
MTVPVSGGVVLSTLESAVIEVSLVPVSTAKRPSSPQAESKKRIRRVDRARMA